MISSIVCSPASTGREQDAVVVRVRLGAEHGDVVQVGRDLQQLFERAHAGHAVADHHQFHLLHASLRRAFDSKRGATAASENGAMSFEVEIGQASRRGPREVNEDFAAATRSAPGDPVPRRDRGDRRRRQQRRPRAEAAQTSVLGLLADFFATPATWETTVALDRLIGAQNAWLVAQNRQRAGATDAAALTTLSALVLQGQGWTVAHVGDTRIWRIAGGEIQQLTHDHAYAQPDQRSRLTRAVGLDEVLHVDYLQGEARLGDCFVLTSDGVHGVLRPRRLGELALRRAARRRPARRWSRRRWPPARKDNVTALVLQRASAWTPPRSSDETARTRAPAAAAALRVGEAVDGYTVTALVADTGVHRLYQARDSRTRRAGRAEDAARVARRDREERAMLAHEAWLAQRVTERDARGFVRCRERRRRHRAVHRVRLAWRPDARADAGAGARASRSPRWSPRRARSPRALGRLHRQGVVHRDIKPGNLHLGDDGQWRVLDLGVALSGRESAAARELHAGTPSYINPEQWDGALPDAGSRPVRPRRHAVPLARPAGCPTARSSPTRRRATGATRRPPSRIRPDVPIWLDHLVLQGDRARSAAALRDRRGDAARARARRLAPGQRAGRHAAGRARPGGAVEDRAGRLAALQRCCWSSGCCSCRIDRASAADRVAGRRVVGGVRPASGGARPPFSAQVRVQRICTTRSITSISQRQHARRRRSPTGRCRCTAWTGPSRWG